jgi:purine-cytosine permease-like protein
VSGDEKRQLNAGEMAGDNGGEIAAAALKQLPESEIYDTRILGARDGGQKVAQDDYALRRVPASWRWSAWGCVWALSGISTAMAFPLTAGLLALFYGGAATLTAIALTLLYAAVGVYLNTRKAANEGAIIELISKHTFGFKGAAFEIVLYGLLGVVYFSLEGHVMAAALSEVIPDLPYWASVAIICVGFVPLCLYGMQFLTRFQSITAWIYGLGVALVFVALFTGWSKEVGAPLAPHPWWNINPNSVPYSWRSVLGAFGAMSGVLGAIMILLSPSTARFARRNESGKVAVLMSLFGAVFPLGLAMSFGVYLLAASGGKIPDPGVSLPRLLGPIGLLLVVLTQLRVNVINVYFGTTALENFAAQIFKFKWSRVRLLGPFMICAYLLLVSPFLKYFGTIMTILSVFLVNWVSVIAGELWLVRPRYAIPSWAEFRRGYVASYNRIGLISMWLPTGVGVVMASGRLGADAQVLAVPVTGVAALIMPPLVAAFLRRDRIIRQYFARVPARVGALQESHACPRCSETFHRSDFVQCPFHGHIYICSGCCAAEQGCGMMCHAVGRTAS